MVYVQSDAFCAYFDTDGGAVVKIRFCVQESSDNFLKYPERGFQNTAIAFVQQQVKKRPKAEIKRSIATLREIFAVSITADDAFLLRLAPNR